MTLATTVVVMLALWLVFGFVLGVAIGRMTR